MANPDEMLQREWGVLTLQLGAQAQVLLQVALEHTPSSPPLRMALCALDTLFGNGAGAVQQAEALQLRHVQMDSMSHHVLPAAAASIDESVGPFLRQVLLPPTD